MHTIQVPSGITVGGREEECPLSTSHQEISAYLLGKARWKEKWKNGEEKKENQKREGGKFKMEGGKDTKWGEYLFCFSLFKTIEICFGCTKMGISYWKKNKHFTPGKKIRKNDFATSEKYSCYAPAAWLLLLHSTIDMTYEKYCYIPNILIILWLKFNSDIVLAITCM